MRAAFASFVSGQAPSYESDALPGDAPPALLQPGTGPRHDRAARLPRRRAAPRLRAGRGGGGRLRQPPDQLQSALPDETCLPALAEGARSAGRDLEADGFETVIGTSVITGATPAAVDRERERQRRLLAFLYSTPAYAPTLELYGWDDLGPRLRELIRRDRWDDLGAVLSDEVLDTLVPAGTFDELAGVLAQRFAGLGQGITVSVPGGRGGRRGVRRRRGRAAGGLTAPCSARAWGR